MFDLPVELNILVVTIHGELGTLWLAMRKSRWRSLGSESAGQGLGDTNGAGQRIGNSLVQDIIRSGQSLGQVRSSSSSQLRFGNELCSSRPQLVRGPDELRIVDVELLDVGQVPGGVLLLLELHQAGSPPAAVLALPVERTVALGVGIVSGDATVRTLVVPKTRK